MMQAQPADVRPGDLGIAAAVAIATLTLTVLALELAHIRRADAPIIDPGIGVPIRVKPVLDLEAPGASAGGKGEASLPSEWARPEPMPEPQVSTATAPATPRRRKPNPARPTQPTPPTQTSGEEAPPGEPAPEGGSTGGEGQGDGSGVDPLGVRAIAAYRERLIRWLSARFEVRGSGLGAAELAQMKARAQIEISEDGVVVDYTILSADHPAFDAAARVALDAVKGEPVPPPPEYYPGAIQRRIKVTFVCTESTCD